MNDEEQPVRQSDRTLRLVFEYEGDHVRLISRDRVEMVTPPSDPIRGPEAASGFMAELRDADERGVYRKVMRNPMLRAVEVRSDDPERPLEWQEMREPSGTFVMMMPDFDDAASLVFLSSPPEFGADAAMAPMTELARFDLTREPEGGE